MNEKLIDGEMHISVSFCINGNTVDAYVNKAQMQQLQEEIDD